MCDKENECVHERERGSVCVFVCVCVCVCVCVMKFDSPSPSSLQLPDGGAATGCNWGRVRIRLLPHGAVARQLPV